jgi:hypothetical protein
VAPADKGDPASGPPPPITEADNVTYVGKYVLIGITNEDAFGNVVSKRQMHGVIERITPGAIEVSLRGSGQGTTYKLPPDLRSLFPARPGEYRLRETGEVVVDPDYTTSWTLKAPQKH